MRMSMLSPRARARHSRKGLTRLAAVIVAATLATGWGPVAPAQAATDELRTPLPLGQGRLNVVAASGSAMLALVSDGGPFEHRISQNLGATWDRANLGALAYFNPSLVEGGRAVQHEVDWNTNATSVSVYSLTDNTVQTYPVSVRLEAANSTTGVTFQPGGWMAVTLATGAPVDLQVEDLTTPDGYWANRTLLMGEASSAVMMTSFITVGTGGVGDGYLDVVPLSGGAGPDPVLVPGLSDAKVIGDEVVYVTASATSLKLCRRALTMATAPSCTDVASGDFRSAYMELSASADWALLQAWGETSSDAWLVEGGSAVGVTIPATARLLSWEGDPVRPLVELNPPTGSSIHQVAADGALTHLLDFPKAPARPERLALTPTMVAGVDRRPSPNASSNQAWTRSVGSTAIGAESLLPSRASQVLASAGRMLSHTESGFQTFDRGVLTGTLPFAERVTTLSGPYYSTWQWDGAAESFIRRLRTVAGGTLPASPVDNFGSLVLEPTVGGGLSVRNAADPSDAPVAVTLPSPYTGLTLGEPRIWGDWIAGQVDHDGVQKLLVLNYRTHALNVYERAEYPVAMGDGLVLLPGAVVNYNTDDQYVLDGVWDAVATDGAHRIAYHTETELVVRTITGTGTSAPRVLGTLVPDPELGDGENWTPAIDVTKPLNAGTLVIKSGDTTVRTLAVPASADGSIRGVSWNGNDTSGARVSAGTYTYELVATAADGTGAVKGVDGIKPAGGTITVVGGAPVTISGATPTVSDATPNVGQTLTATPGTWTPSGVALAYAWFRDTTAITGATAKTYAVQAADLGKKLSVKVTGSLAGSTSVTKTSSQTAAVAAGAITGTTPTLSGTARVSMKLTAVPGTWTPSTVKLSYQWYRVSATGASTAISGATASTYTLASSDKGLKVKVKVTGSQAGYTTLAKYSALSGTILSPMVGGTPTVSDTTPKVDQKLTANTGTWVPSTVTFSYQWYARNSAGTISTITGATAKTYPVNGKYAGYTLRVRVTGSKSGYAPVSKYSAWTSAVAKGTFTTKPIPTISGTKVVGQTLTANTGTWTPTPSSYSYQWYRSGVAVSGQTAKTYKLASIDRGKTITVKVTARRTGYVSASTTSAPTAKIA